jgi:hypothetical protein
LGTKKFLAPLAPFSRFSSRTGGRPFHFCRRRARFFRALETTSFHRENLVPDLGSILAHRAERQQSLGAIASFRRHRADWLLFLGQSLHATGPHELAVKFEMNYGIAVVERQYQILPAPPDSLDSSPAQFSLESLCCFLFSFPSASRGGNGMNHAALFNFTALDKRPETLRDSFDFGQFGHRAAISSLAAGEAESANRRRGLAAVASSDGRVSSLLLLR